MLVRQAASGDPAEPRRRKVATGGAITLVTRAGLDTYKSLAARAPTQEVSNLRLRNAMPERIF